MASLDKTLDDMIKRSRNSDKGGRGQGRLRRGRGRGMFARGGGQTFAAVRRNPLGVNPRPSASTIAKSFRRTKNLPWQKGLFDDSLRAAGISGFESGTKLYVSNLAVGVTSEDIRELFSEIGELVRYALHFDKNGRSSGSAEVVFERRSDAFQAFKRYNNVQLDGKPMKIEIVGVKDETPIAAARVNVAGVGGKRTVVMASTRAGTVRGGGGFGRANRVSSQRGRFGPRNVRGGGARGGGRGGRRGGGVWRKKTAEKTADDLDKELDSYHAEAMQT